MKRMRIRGNRGSRRGQAGSAAIEYLLVTSLVVIVLVAEPNIVVELMNAIKQVYRAFTFALGLTYPTPSTL